MQVEYQNKLILHRGSFDAYVDEKGILILPLSLRRFIPDSVAHEAELLLSYFEIAKITIRTHQSWSKEEYLTAMAEFKALLTGHVPDHLLRRPNSKGSQDSRRKSM